MKEALKLALEAFETLTQYNMVRANIFRRFEPTCTGDYVDLREFREKAKPAITAIKEVLAQPEQDKERCVGCEACIDTACGRDECPKGWPKAPQRTWVGLTDEESVELMRQVPHLTIGGLLAVEAKLKEKNT